MMEEENKKEQIERFYEWFLDEGGLWISLGVVIIIVVTIALIVLHKTSENINTNSNGEEKKEIE